MVEQGYAKGACATRTPDGQYLPACQATMRIRNGQFERVIKSIHLSRPEHYLSIYQSGCNHDCAKCHSAEFSQVANGRWMSTDEIAMIAVQYAEHVTVWEPRERATMWHATDLCRSCGSCVLYGRRSPLCPSVLNREQIVLSPQGWGPARNIVAFTGGDIVCRAEFYAECTRKIKSQRADLHVLIETNGYGLTPRNLDILADAGVDSFWLDIKAYDDRVYQRLCGTTNEWILRAPKEILARGMVVEVLSLFIPNWVECDQLAAIAKLVADADPMIPFTILAFFPSHRFANLHSPTAQQMLDAYHAVRSAGLQNVKLGNCGVFIKTEDEWMELVNAIGASVLA